MVKKITLFVLFAFALKAKSQCIISGAMGVYNSCNNGQGCTAGCNLTAFNAYGPMCNGTGVTGNCFGSGAGQQNISTSYNLPAGCTVSVVAEYKKRGAACSNSGMDSGDLLGINGTGIAGVNVGNCGLGATFPGVIAGGCQGLSNADVNVTYSQTGGVITVWGAANRSDEIITFTLTLTGTCGPSCNLVLPIEVINFWGEKSENTIDIKWVLATQRNVDYFSVEKSTDGLKYSLLGNVPVKQVLSGEKIDYSFSDQSPIKGINYYRLRNVDLDGTKGEYKILAVNYEFDSQLFWNEQNDEKLIIHLNKNFKHETIQLINFGSIIMQFNPNEINNNTITIDKSHLAKGLYILKTLSGERISNSKVIID